MTITSQSSDLMNIEADYSTLYAIIQHNRKVARQHHLEDTIYVNTREVVEFITEDDISKLGDDYDPNAKMVIIDYHSGRLVTGNSVDQLCKAVGIEY